MSRQELFGELNELTGMNRDIVPSALIELRGGLRENPIEIIKWITRQRADFDNGFSNVGGNSNYLVNHNGRIQTEWYQGFQTAVLRAVPPVRETPDIEIWPLNVSGTYEPGLLTFFPTSKGAAPRFSVVLTRPSSEDHTFLQPAAPLFNVREDGVVLARINEPPTPDELGLFQDILDSFVEAADPISVATAS